MERELILRKLIFYLLLISVVKYSFIIDTFWRHFVTDWTSPPTFFWSPSLSSLLLVYIPPPRLKWQKNLQAVGSGFHSGQLRSDIYKAVFIPLINQPRWSPHLMAKSYIQRISVRCCHKLQEFFYKAVHAECQYP